MHPGIRGWRDHKVQITYDTALRCPIHTAASALQASSIAWATGRYPRFEVQHSACHRRVSAAIATCLILLLPTLLVLLLPVSPTC